MNKEAPLIYRQKTLWEAFSQSNNSNNGPYNMPSTSLLDMFDRCVRRFDNNVKATFNFIKTMPGMASKITFNDRRLIAGRTAFPVLICRSLFWHDSLNRLFGIDHHSAVFFFNFFNQHNIDYLHKLLMNLRQRFLQMHFTDSEISMIYGLLIFNSNFLSNLQNLENSTAVQQMIEIYLQLNDNFSQKKNHQNDRVGEIVKFIKQCEQLRQPMLSLAQEMLYLYSSSNHGSTNHIRDVVCVDVKLSSTL